MCGPTSPAGRRDQWTDGQCAACQRPVRLWECGERCVILDPDPTDEGDTVIVNGEPIGVVREDVVGRYTLYRSHFYTCPARLVETAM